MSLRCLRVQRTEVCTIGQGLHVGIADSSEDEPLPAGSAPCIPGSALCYLLDVIGAPPSPLKLSQDIVTCLLGAKSPQVRTCYKKKTSKGGSEPPRTQLTQSLQCPALVPRRQAHSHPTLTKHLLCFTLWAACWTVSWERLLSWPSEKLQIRKRDRRGSKCNRQCHKGWTIMSSGETENSNCWMQMGSARSAEQGSRGSLLV